MKNKDPLVAVLLSAYNGMSWIEDQVVSILSQDGVSIRLFISVDLSSDITYEWCKDFASRNARVKVLPYGERFGGAAKNFYRLIRDVDFSTFDYVALSDQDDLWNVGKLQRAISVIKEKSLSGYSSDVVAFYANGNKRLVKKSFPQKKMDYFFESGGPGCTYVLKQQSAEKFKKFLASNWGKIGYIESHDWLIYAFFRSRGMPWYIDNSALMLYRQHESNQVGSNSGLSAYIKRVKMIKNGWYRTEVEKILRAVGVNCEFSLKRWFLIKHFYQLRRRNRDVVVLLMAIFAGWF